jgi:hypothetical protein
VGVVATSLLLVGVTGCNRIPPVSRHSVQTTKITHPVEASTNAHARPVYLHSVIPGGVGTRSELQQSVAADPVVAEHYRGVPIDSLQPKAATRPFFAFVSYRKGNQVFWTRRQVRIAKDELLLTSGGENLVRARCGNRISNTPQRPVLDADVEPGIDDFDQIDSPGAEAPAGRTRPAVPPNGDTAATSNAAGEAPDPPASPADAAHVMGAGRVPGFSSGWLIGPLQPLDRSTLSRDELTQTEPLTGAEFVLPDLDGILWHTWRRPVTLWRLSGTTSGFSGNPSPPSSTFPRTPAGFLLSPPQLAIGSLETGGEFGESVAQPSELVESEDGTPDPRAVDLLPRDSGTPPPLVAVPEPATCLLMACGALGLVVLGTCRPVKPEKSQDIQ